MTPPCLNCHNTPDTPPDLLHHPAISPDPLDKLASPGPHFLPVCSAEPHWPDWLQKNFTGMQNTTWWTRANFESTRRTKAESDGTLIAPFRLNMPAASLKASLKLTAGSHNLFQLMGFNVADLILDSGASVQGGLQVKDNAIVLRGAAGSSGYPDPLDLFTFSGIKIDAPVNFNFWPHRVTVGNWGEMHFIMQPTSAYRFLADPYMVPRPPLGHDFPTDQQMEAKGQEWISTPVEYPHPKNNPDSDIVLTAQIPEALLEADGRLPENYNLETLTARVIAFLAKRPKPDQPSKLKLAEVLDYLEPDSKIEISLDSIKDFLLPGVLDLAESNAKAELRLTQEKLIELKVPELNLFLDPMDYPATPDENRPPIHLLEGSIQSSPSFVTKSGRTIESGIHALYDPVTGVAELSVNVFVHANVELPLFGKVDVDGHVLLETQFLKTPEGFKLFPRTTTIQLDGLNITKMVKEEIAKKGDPKKKEEISKQITLANLNISITDDENKVPEVTRWEFEKPDSALATFNVNGMVGIGENGWVDFSGHLPLPKGADGSYDFSRILQNLPLEAMGTLSTGKSNYQTKLSLSSLDPWTYKLDPLTEKTYVLDFDVDHGGPDAKGKYVTKPFVDKGQLYVRKTHVGEEHNQWVVALGANLVKFEGLLSDLGVKNEPLKKLELKGFDTEFRIDHAKHLDGITDVRIPVFHIATQGSNQGPLRGSLKIEQVATDKTGVDIRWDSRHRKFNLKGLDLALSVQQLDLLPPPIKRLLNKRIATIGIDGHLKGNFEMNFPDDKKYWNGAGNILLRGDPAGDVYFLDSRGNQVGPSFIRDTRWEIRRINWLNVPRQYALGDFYLDIILNMGALLPSIPSPDPAAIPVYGAHGQKLNPFEINGVMPYDNMPWSVTGFNNRIVDYVLKLCSEDQECSQSMYGGASNGGKETAK